MAEIEPRYWSEVRPIRCPSCAHRFGYTLNRPNAPITLWEQLIWHFASLRPSVIKTPITVTADDTYIGVVAFSTLVSVYCGRCDARHPFEDWLACGQAPIQFIEHWENMCECGGEFWADPSTVGTTMRFTCDRCDQQKQGESL